MHINMKWPFERWERKETEAIETDFFFWKKALSIKESKFFYSGKMVRDPENGTLLYLLYYLLQYYVFLSISEFNSTICQKY